MEELLCGLWLHPADQKATRFKKQPHQSPEKNITWPLLKKKSYQKNKKNCKFLLRYLERLLGALQHLMDQYPLASLSAPKEQKLNTIKALREQQQQIYLKGEPKVEGRIVSLHYVRPIVRGKQTKPVEFGCKVQVLQIDGINFIEHLSYENFNEGTRLKSTIALQQRYVGSCSQLGADRIYATNANRKHCTRQHIANSFIPKGKAGKQAEQKASMRSLLAGLRGSVMEGSFGNEKLHYCLDKVKAGSEATERVWIFFSMLTSNSVQIARRMHAKEQNKEAA